MRRSYEDALACDDASRWFAAVVALLAPPPEPDAVIVDVEAHGGAGSCVSVSEEAVGDDGASDDTVDQEEAEEAAVARAPWGDGGGDAIVEAVLEEVKAKLAPLRFEGSPKGRGRTSLDAALPAVDDSAYFRALEAELQTPEHRLLSRDEASATVLLLRRFLACAEREVGAREAASRSIPSLLADPSCRSSFFRALREAECMPKTARNAVVTYRRLCDYYRSLHTDDAAVWQQLQAAKEATRGVAKGHKRADAACRASKTVAELLKAGQWIEFPHLVELMHATLPLFDAICANADRVGPRFLKLGTALVVLYSYMNGVPHDQPSNCWVKVRKNDQTCQKTVGMT